MPGLDNISEIAALLHIREKTINEPSLKAIHDAALQALIQHNNTHVEAAKPEELPPTAPPATLAGEPEPDEGKPAEGGEGDPHAPPVPNGNGDSSLRRI